ncbi:ORF50 [Turkey adenovirus 1]|uniref:ORF50 n=1 Tax=Turkey adenovirus 1 TaxID=878329 RepID=E0YC85_9ADEN|nr:ORF50 [Turkey adenovirus 1]ADM53818.1 ORF50 [Turkey adenovirus 1]
MNPFPKDLTCRASNNVSAETVTVPLVPPDGLGPHHRSRWIGISAAVILLLAVTLYLLGTYAFLNRRPDYAPSNHRPDLISIPRKSLLAVFLITLVIVLAVIITLSVLLLTRKYPPLRPP